MVQVYFLLVLVNLVGGAVLARGMLKQPQPLWDGVFALFEPRLVRGIFGALTFLSGFLGLMFVLPGDQLFVGDLLPSVSALLSGTVLVLEFYSKDPEPGLAGDLLVKNRILIGLVALVLGSVHFLIPGVMFL